MADTFTKERRSKIMASVHSTHTKPELLVRRLVKGMGFVYQPKTKGSPDFINTKKKVAIFVNGCFWHGCKICRKVPKTNKAYWLPKIRRTMQRDRQNRSVLRAHGYKVFTLWEHQLKNVTSPKQIRILID